MAVSSWYGMRTSDVYFSPFHPVRNSSSFNNKYVTAESNIELTMLKENVVIVASINTINTAKNGMVSQSGEARVVFRYNFR